MTAPVEPMTADEEASLRRVHPVRHDVGICDGCAAIAIIDALRATVAAQAKAIAAMQQNTLSIAGYVACTHPRATVTPPATAGNPMTYCPDCRAFWCAP